MTVDQITALFLILVGGFSLGSALANWDGFFNHPRSRFIVEKMGRSGARIFYIVLGFILAGIGVASLTGLIPAPE
ncbi:MAG: immunity 17 family protein [Bacteroidota bacterium]